MGLDIVELVMCVEEKFDIQIPNDLAATLTSPRKLCKAVSELREEKGLPVDSEAIENGVKEIVFQISGISDEIYSLDGKFVEDFGLD